ncbi:MAG: sulfatase-like hydrolase/transferase [Rikenellaceae bacterium]
MNVKLPLISGLTLTCFIPKAQSEEVQQKQPNILCIVCEDISLNLGCYGDSVAITPNLDKFAEESILFSQMHTTVGVSAPSRFALITGMYPSAMGANYMRTFTQKKEQFPEEIEPYYVVLPDEVKGYTEFMRAAGYYCTNKIKQDYQFNSPMSLWDDAGGDWKKCPEDMPFFSIINLGITHESQVWLQADAELHVNPDDIIVPPYYPDNDIIRRDMAVMYSNVTRMDSQFQDLVDELKASDRYDNTIIMFLSDNGGPLPRQKRAIYESGTHVPFMVKFPDGYKKGTVDDRLSMFIDIPATVLSLTGVKPPKYMQGQALLGEYEAKKDREYVYAARDRMDEQRDKQGVVKDHNFRYIRNYNYADNSNYIPVQYRYNMPMMLSMLDMLKNGELNDTQMLWFDAENRPQEEFYDDVNDPHNVNNLINDPQYQDDIERMRKELDKWIKNESPRWMLTEKESRDLMLPDGVQPSLNDVVFVTKKDKLVLSSDNKGASIVYKINGEGHTPNSWMLYTEPIEGLKSGDVISARATRAGYNHSERVEFTY